MDEERKILNLIGKLMSEEAECIGQAKREYIAFKKYYTDQYIQCLDNGGYNDNASIVSRLNDICEEMEFFDAVPCLLGKRFVNIHNSTEEAAECLHDICELSETIRSIDSIPVVLINNDEIDETQYYVMTGTHKFIQISENEMSLVDELEDHNIEKRKLIQFVVVKQKMSVENICICFWPEKMLSELKCVRYFWPEHENYIIANSFNYVKRRLLSNIQEKLCVIAPAELHESIVSGLSENQRNQIKGVKSPKSFIETVNKKESTFDNYIVSNRIQNIILDVEVYYHTMIRKCKNIQKVMIEDLVHLPEGEVRDSISNRKQSVQNRKQFYEELLQKYYNVCEELLKLIRKYQNCRKQQLCKDSAVRDLYYDKYLEKIFFKLVYIEEFKRANDCLNCMRDMKIENILVFELFLDYHNGAELSQEKILELKSIENCNEAIARVKIALGDIAEYSYAEIEEFSVYLVEPIYAKEFYVIGIRCCNEEKYSEAAKYFRKAYELGNEASGQELLRLALEYPKESEVKIEDLTKMMIPEANYYMAGETDDEEATLVNLKIAAAKKHFESVEISAGLLFDRCKELSYEDMRQKSNQEDVINVINLYEYLKGITSREEYTLRIGLMYCKLSDFKRAYEHLSSVDTPAAYYECALMYENGMGVAKNLEEAKRYYRKCGNYKDASVQAMKISELLREGYRNEESSNSRNRYGEERETVSVERSGFCFITTAACMALHEHKNCEALNMLRTFRDEHISDGDVGDLLIKEYYRIGPEIVKNIDKEWNPNGIYMQLWEYYISPSCDEIGKSNFDKAKNIYIDMVKRLCEKYNIQVEEKICNLYNINYN